MSCRNAGSESLEIVQQTTQEMVRDCQQDSSFSAEKHEKPRIDNERPQLEEQLYDETKDTVHGLAALKESSAAPFSGEGAKAESGMVMRRAAMISTSLSTAQAPSFWVRPAAADDQNEGSVSPTADDPLHLQASIDMSYDAPPVFHLEDQLAQAELSYKQHAEDGMEDSYDIAGHCPAGGVSMSDIFEHWEPQSQ
jgi:hypothetical protein